VGDIIKLRTAKKARASAQAEVNAAANRALHGRTKEQKRADRAERERAERTLDGARIEPE
jgi:hypothetical protein